MKALRLALYFLVGFLLSTVTVFAYAETMAATATQGQYANPFWGGITESQACASGGSLPTRPDPPAGHTCLEVQSGPICGGSKTWYFCKENASGGGAIFTFSATTYTCDTSQGWSGPTLVNGVQTCSRPDTPCPIYGAVPKDSQGATAPAGCSCPAGTSWSAYDGCRKTCGGGPWAAGQNANGGFSVFIADGQTEGCHSSCGVQHKAGAYDIAKGGRMAPATYTGWACSGNGEGTLPAPVPTPDSPAVDPAKKKPPVCGAGEGVITSSSGNVMCLPPGTPNTSTPKVEKAKTVETYPDNTTKTVETTKTTDPNTGATDTRTSSTSTAKPDGSAGQAGAPGTTTGTDNNGGVDGDGDGDGDGDCDPREKMCSKPGVEGLYTKGEKTVQGVMESFINGVKGSEIGQAGTGFFTVNAGSGSCPSWVASVEWFNWSHDIGQYFCNQTALSALDMFGTVLLVVVSYIAFMWAVF